MYKCKCCNREFETPEIGTESFGIYMGLEAVTEFGICPYCGDDDIVESTYKDVYDEYIYPGDMYYDLGDVKVKEENIKEFLKDCECTAG